MRKRFIASLALASALALGITGCSGNKHSEPSASASASSATSSTTGKMVTPVENTTDMPSIKGEVGKAPEISWQEGKSAPKNLIRNVLVKGSGELVHPDSTITANYCGWVWNGKEPFDSSFAKGGEPLTISLDSVVKGWKYGLSGTHVGDRVLLSIPSDLGYGAKGAGNSIPPNSTLVFVVDILKQESIVNAQPTGADLPVEIEGKLGEPITAIKVKPGYQEVKEPKITVVAKGGDRGISMALSSMRGIVVHISSINADGSDFFSSYQSGQAVTLEIKASDPIMKLFEGQTVKSRVVLEIPKSEQSKAQIAVVDILDGTNW